MPQFTIRYREAIWRTTEFTIDTDEMISVIEPDAIPGQIATLLADARANDVDSVEEGDPVEGICDEFVIIDEDDSEKQYSLIDGVPELISEVGPASK
jgi:hypothetical protein